MIVSSFRCLWSEFSIQWCTWNLLTLLPEGRWLVGLAHTASARTVSITARTEFWPGWLVQHSRSAWGSSWGSRGTSRTAAFKNSSLRSYTRALSWSSVVPHQGFIRVHSQCFAPARKCVHCSVVPGTLIRQPGSSLSAMQQLWFGYWKTDDLARMSQIR